jgi:hypothetical protein
MPALTRYAIFPMSISNNVNALIFTGLTRFDREINELIFEVLDVFDR